MVVDVDSFDGKLVNEDSRLILHDGRSEHKGKRLFEHLVKVLPEWRFETLNCKPEEVPDRMREAAAFLHLSRYEGNSIVCNEAMAMNLPCLFTRVGLMNDDEPLDVSIVESSEVYGSKKKLVETVQTFLEGLSTRTYQPRNWTMQNATPEAHVAAWRDVMGDFGERFGFEALTNLS